MENLSLHLDHVALPIRDVEGSYRFYTDLLRLPLVEALSGDDWGGYPWLMMIYALGDGRRLALCAFAGAERAPDSVLPKEAGHLAFAVRSEEELARWRSRLRAASVALSAEEHADQRSLYFEDPNGNVLEITAPPTPSAGRIDAHAAEVVEQWRAKYAPT